MQDIQTLRWSGGEDGYLILIDQTVLPEQLTHIECRDVASVWEAIKSLRVRGAPAIGIAAAYGVCLGIQAFDTSDKETFLARVKTVADELATSRPTAVNLFWALNRMCETATLALADQSPAEVRRRLLTEAIAIHDEDRRMCRAIGRHGAPLLPRGAGVLTHCNAGGLATSEYGTALAVIFSAWEDGNPLHVFVDETRPLLQGARLTTWELMQRGIPTTLICDSMAAQVMREGRVQAVVTGADRIAANGDSANKIGTYSLAVLASAHNIPFYIAAPSSTFDRTLDSGEAIPIEQRASREITHGFGRATAPEGVDVYNPAFDVTPADRIRAIVTECGVIEPVTRQRIAKVLGE